MFDHENELELISGPAIKIEPLENPSVVGIPGTQKLAYDILVVGRTKSELLERIERVLEQCKEHNFMLSDSKMQLETEAYTRINDEKFKAHLEQRGRERGSKPYGEVTTYQTIILEQRKISLRIMARGREADRQ